MDFVGTMSNARAHGPLIFLIFYATLFFTQMENFFRNFRNKWVQ